MLPYCSAALINFIATGCFVGMLLIMSPEKKPCKVCMQSNYIFEMSINKILAIYIAS